MIVKTNPHNVPDFILFTIVIIEKKLKFYLSI